MTMKTIYAAIWVDNMLGPLSLLKNTAQEAITAAQGIRAKGADKVHTVRAVKLEAYRDEVEDLQF